MRILLISRCPPLPLHLGDRLIIYHLARELAARGHVIDLLAFGNAPTDWETDWSRVPYFNSIQIVEEPRRLIWAYLRRWLLPRQRFPLHPDDAWSPQMWHAITAQLKQTAYDVVHLFGGVQVYEFLGAVRSVPHLIVPYESYSLYLERSLEASRGIAALAVHMRSRLARAYEHFMFAPYPAVVVVSERDQQTLLGINPAIKVITIPNGIDPEQFVEVEDKTRAPCTLLFIGNYEYAPNVDAALYLLDVVFPEVREHFPDARLQLVGNAPPVALTARAGANIEVTGRVPDVRPYLAHATAFVCPLRLGAGIKNKILEALAMGCPVVTTQVGADGIAVVSGQHALITALDDVADAVVRLLHEPQLQTRLSVEGKALIAARYSWGQVAERYETLYTDVIHRVSSEKL